MPSESASVKVVAKVRPLIPDEVNKGVSIVTKVEGDKVIVQPPGKNSTFLLDGTFSPEAKHSEVFNGKVEPYVKRALEGYNVAILAFGATGSGKSYLMSGMEDNPGIVPCFNRSLCKHIGEKSGKEFFLTVSFVEILDEEVMDLLNPHQRPMQVRQHPQKGIYVGGLSEMVAHNLEELENLYIQGNRARKGGATDLRAHRERAQSIFTVTVEQKEKQSSRVGVRARIQFVDLPGINSGKSKSKSGMSTLLEVISSLGDSKKRGGLIPYRDSILTRLLQDALGGNAFTLMLTTLSPGEKEHADTLATMEYANLARSIKNQVKMNLDDADDIINELRVEICRLRDRLVTNSDPSKEDVLKMEELVEELKIAKKQTWAEREKLSAQHTEERKVTLTNKGMYDWVMESMRRGNREVREKVILLQKEKDQLTLQFKEKRKLLDELNEDLQKKIAEYSNMAQSGKATESETKKKVTAIHDTKERLKREGSEVKEIKQRLKEIQEKQKDEKEGGAAQLTAVVGSVELRQKIQKEELAQMELENRALITGELEKMKLDVDNTKAQIQMSLSEQKTYSAREGADMETELAELRAEKPVLTMKLEMLEREKAKVTEYLDGLFEAHKAEIELQQLQHYQTFRQYRELYEEQKGTIEQRYRQLLEDSIQDAIFLSAKNSVLMEENQEQKQELATMKDLVVKLQGRLS